MATQTEIMAVTPDLAAECIKEARRANRPVMLWGPPGSAKSAVVKQVAEELGIDFIDLRLVQIDAVDLRGLPKVKSVKEAGDTEEVERSYFIPPNWLPRSGSGILFLDELPQSTTITLNAASELLLDRRIGDYNLPDGWSMVAAGNRRSDRAATGEIPSHLKNRLIHLEMLVLMDKWVAWGTNHGIHPHVLSYIQAKPHMLHAFNQESEKAQDRLAVNTCRTWEFASDILKLSPPASPAAQQALLMGCLGKKVALDLEAYLDRGKGLPTYKDIIADPMNAPIPKKESDAWNVLGEIKEKGVVADAGKIAQYLGRPEHTRDHIRPVLSILIMKTSGKKDGQGKAVKQFMDDPTFAALAAQFGEK